MTVEEQVIVDEIKKEIVLHKERLVEKKIARDKVLMLLRRNWIQYILSRRKIRKQVLESQKNSEININNSSEMETYYLSSVFPDIETQDMVYDILREMNRQDLERSAKREYSSYVGLDEEIIQNMSWEDIDERILEASKSKVRVRSIFKQNKINLR